MQLALLVLSLNTSHMLSIILRYWQRLLGRKNFPHALVYGDVSPQAKIAEGVWIPFGTNVSESCSIGRYSYIMPPSHLHHVHIGNFCSLAENITFINQQHNSKAFSTFPFSKRLAMQGISFPELFEETMRKGDIHIEHDVWIGTNSIIMGDVTIGTGAIVGAGSIVTKDVPPYTIVAGAPARPIRKRFDDTTIEKLLKSHWWEWSLEKIEKQAPHLFETK